MRNLTAEHDEDATARLATHETALVAGLPRIRALLEPPPPAPESPANEMGSPLSLSGPKKTR